MVKNKHLLIGVAATSLITTLICLVLLIRENKNGHDISEIQEHGTKYSQETRAKLEILSRDIHERGTKYSQETRENLESLSREIHEHGTRHSQETRKTLQNLEDRKVSDMFLEINNLIQAQKLETEKREKEISALNGENKRLQGELSSQKMESEKREKEMSALKAENKRFHEELSSTNGIRKRIDDLEKKVKELTPIPPNGK